ncbi:MAG: NUDIX hydrolase [Nocardioides sp.]|uniref:NUDIX hydrolase n=1 Tax=Nocardioides sp. TaxID=35761 RepID=UPI003F063C0C
MSGPTRRQRVATYAVLLRETATGPEILLSRLAPRISRSELWTLPGGGLDHGEAPRDGLVREIWEETGLDAQVGERPDVFSSHRPDAEFDGRVTDFHALRIVYDAWVPRDAPEPKVMEVDGSTVDARWHSLDDVRAGRVPIAVVVVDALARRGVERLQRVAAYATVVQDGKVLLTRLSEHSAHPGSWTLPGGGVEHGEAPEAAVVREVEEETGMRCTPGRLLGVHDTHFVGTAPSGQLQDYHGIHLVHEASVEPLEPGTQRPDSDASTAEVAWLDVADVLAGRVEVLDVVRFALERL